MEGSSGQTNASGNLDLCGGGLLDLCWGVRHISVEKCFRFVAVWGVDQLYCVGVSGGSGVS